MAINSRFWELGDPVVAELANLNEKDFEARLESNDAHVALLFNLIRDRYDSSLASVEEEEQ